MLKKILTIYIITLLLYIAPLSVVADVVLNENCSINILNRTIQVQEDGSWAMPNTPSFMGRIKARATCLVDGQTISGESDYFAVVNNGLTEVNDIRFDSVEAIPTALTYIGGDNTRIDSIGTTLQLSVSASYENQDAQDVTFSEGINYISSNQNIATISNEGLVTAVSVGTVLITTRIEGTIALKRIQIGRAPMPISNLKSPWEMVNSRMVKRCI